MAAYSGIREAFDWRSYLDEHFYPLREARGSEVRINCPSCGDADLKCYVNVDKGVFNCFKCDFSSKNYDVFDFVARSEGISRGAALLRLAHEYAPVTTDDLEGYLKSTFEDDKLENVEAGLRSVELPKNTFLLRPLLGKVADPFVEYLLTRGLTLDEIHAMQTHICPVPGTPLYRRVLWPVYGGAKQLVSWNARTIDADTPKHKKYYVCPDSDINKTLWPYLLPQTKRVVLVEGILDCMAVRRFYNDCYATFGKKLSAAQRDLLKTWGVEEVVLLWDKRDAKKEIMKTVEELKLGFKVFVPNFDVWPTKCDPGDALRLPELVPSLQQMVNMPIDVESFQYLSFCL